MLLNIAKKNEQLTTWYFRVKMDIYNYKRLNYLDSVTIGKNNAQLFQFIHKNNKIQLKIYKNYGVTQQYEQKISLPFEPNKKAHQ